MYLLWKPYLDQQWHHHGKHRIAIKYWFIAIQLLTSANEPVSSSEIQNLLGAKQPEPVYVMYNKLRLQIANGATNFDSLLMACAKNLSENGTQASSLE